jgi:Skp family chaperone for outer membrane proteins
LNASVQRGENDPRPLFCPGIAGFASLALLILLAATATAAQPPPRIVVVDPDAVLARLMSWQRTQEKLKADREAAEKKLAAAKQELDRRRAELDYFRPGSQGHERRRARLVEEQQKWLALRDRLRSQLAEAARSAREEAEKLVRSGIAAFAKKHGHRLILDARAAFFVADGLDVSVGVARDMNRRYKGGRVNP